MIWHALREITFAAMVAVAIYFCVAAMKTVNLLVR